MVCCDSRLCFRYDALTFYHLAIRYEMSSDKESTLVSMLEAAVMNRLKLFRASFFFLIYIYIYNFSFKFYKYKKFMIIGN